MKITLEELEKLVEDIKQLKMRVVKMQEYQEAAHLRNMERKFLDLLETKNK